MFIASPSIRDGVGRIFDLHRATIGEYYRNFRNNDTGYDVYLINCKGTEFYKIGISKNPQNRIYSMSTSNPYDLICILTIQLPNFKDAEYVEALFHETYSFYNKKNEWFTFSSKILGAVIKDMFDIYQTYNKYLGKYPEVICPLFIYDVNFVKSKEQNWHNSKYC